MKATGIVLALALALACGGGGSSPADLTGSAAPQSVAQSILEDCALTTVFDYLDIVNAVGGLLDPAATSAPVFSLEGIDILKASIDWSLDLDNDGVADLTGTIRFTDAADNPTLPFDLLQLLTSGFSDLPDLLGTVRDGTRMHLDYTGTGALSSSGGFVVDYTGGLPSDVSGNGAAQSGSCSGSFSFDTTNLLDLRGIYPRIDLDLTLQSSGGRIDGTMTLDGTNTARVVVRTNGGTQTSTYLVNLDSGAVTPVS